MPDPAQRRLLRVKSPDGAEASIQLHLGPAPRAVLYWLPALGVGRGPNERFADALAAQGMAVAVHEWRGVGQSNRRAARACDWGYRELIEFDIPAGLDAVDAELGVVPRWIGGHSLGGQFALIEAASGRRALQGVVLVASGQPHWRAFDGLHSLLVLAFAASIWPITALAGYFPGTRLGFAGREARRLMRDWAGTALRGDYRVPGHGDALDAALARYAGRILALGMSEDRLAPRASLQRLQRLVPVAQWQVQHLGREDFATRRPDHFGWLREPGAVVDRIRDYCLATGAPSLPGQGAVATAPAP